MVQARGAGVLDVPYQSNTLSSYFCSSQLSVHASLCRLVHTVSDTHLEREPWEEAHMLTSRVVGTVATAS